MSNYRKNIRKIAKKHGISVKEVEREMQTAINNAYVSPGLYAECIPRVGKTPTPNEVITYVSGRVIKIK